MTQLIILHDHFYLNFILYCIILNKNTGHYKLLIFSINNKHIDVDLQVY